MTSFSLPSLEQIAQLSLACQIPVDWLSDSDRTSNFIQEHAFDQQLATDLDLAEKRATHFNLGISAECYLNTWVTVKDDLNAMLSIRFFNMNPDQPFVDATITTRPLRESDMIFLRKAAHKAYPKFNVKRLRFWSSGPKKAFLSTETDMRALAIPITYLQETEKNDIRDEIRIAPSIDSKNYMNAQKAYEDINSEFPQHNEQAQLISEDVLNECITAGTMFDVFRKDKWCGYIGVLPEIHLGFKTYTIQELLLTKEARGFGFGAELNLALARNIKAEGHVLFGTIHGNNRGAITSALRAGRLDLGGWHWLSV